jgi:hypothetical protein
MRRIVLTTVLAAALAPVLTTAASAAVPRLAIATSSPFVVAGVNFAPHELVTVTFGSHVRRVRVTALGTFRAGFADVAYDRCTGFQIVAAGARGDRAVLVRARPMCAPLSSP